MQIAGRPFDESAVLRIGHAYEKAAGWHRRHPDFEGERATSTPDVGPPRKVEVDAEGATYVDALAARAGLNLDGAALESFHFGAQAALAIARRLPRDHAWHEAPANVFRFPERD